MSTVEVQPLSTWLTTPMTFDVPEGRWAHQPPEARGVPRDQVRLMVARPERLDHRRFADLGQFLRAGDLVVVNTSATRPAAIDAVRTTGRVTLHLSTKCDDGSWVVELRTHGGAHPVLDGQSGEVIGLDGGGHVRLDAPVAAGPIAAGPVGAVVGGTAAVRQFPHGVRLWSATVVVDGRVEDHMRIRGRPITYGPGTFPLSDYQTVFARHPGSAEMASAGRPFSTRLVAQLLAQGVMMAPVTLHAGVSSQQAGEAPQPEWFEVPDSTAALVNHTRDQGGRIIAVGTTVTRALESSVSTGANASKNRLQMRKGWTDLVITPDRGVAVVDGLITGWHEPEASHLLLLQAVAGRDLVQRAYQAALERPYLWHEFGDTCLLLP